jgi:DNA-binding transcriptional LysR family regulator
MRTEHQLGGDSSNSFSSRDNNERLWHPNSVELDLAQIRAFIAVVDHQHFGEAAQALWLSQQAVSKRVARLEAMLGPLFERRRGGVSLTPVGQRLLPAARRLLEAADEAAKSARSAPLPLPAR